MYTYVYYTCIHVHTYIDYQHYAGFEIVNDYCVSGNVFTLVFCNVCALL